MTSELDYESRVLARTDVPDGWDHEVLDVRTLGPPEPLRQTLNLLVDLPLETAVVQINDRAPQHLYPKLEDRGYTYQTVEFDDAVGTAIWAAEE